MADTTRRWITGLGVATMLALTACSDGGGNDLAEGTCPSKTPVVWEDGEELTLDEVTDRVAEAVTCPGHVFHVTSTNVIDSGDYRVSQETESWIDLAENLGRSALRISHAEGTTDSAKETIDAFETPPAPADLAVTILRTDGTYSMQQSDGTAGRHAPRDCHGLDRVALHLLISCPGPLVEQQTTVEQRSLYQGDPAIVISNTGTSSSDDGIYDFTRKLYFDRRTFLPLGSVMDGTRRSESAQPEHVEVAFQYDFVTRDSLAGDFFDPASIGYVEKNPLDALDNLDFDVELYWLGEEFAGGEAYPPIVFDSLSGVPEGVPEYYDVILNYRRLDDEFGPNVVTVMLYTREDWDAFIAQSFGGNWWDQPCVQKSEYDLPDRHVIAYARAELQFLSGDDCAPPDAYGTHVFIGNTVVDVEAPGAASPEGSMESPYDTPEGIDLLARSLQLREK